MGSFSLEENRFVLARVEVDPQARPAASNGHLLGTVVALEEPDTGPADDTGI